MNRSSVGRVNGRRQWQKEFLDMLLQIQRLLRFEFRLLRPHEREEAVQNATVICMDSYARLHAQGRTDAANAWSLARYAALQHRSGRIAGGQLNSKDAMSRYAAIRSGIKQLRPQRQDQQNWIDELVADKRARVHDLVAARLDTRAWFNTLRPGAKKVAADLAQGCTTLEAARKHRVSPGRISQIRRELERSWKLFQHEPILA